MSCEFTLKDLLAKIAVETSQAVERLYWETFLLVAPTTYIFAPFELKEIPLGAVSCELKLNDLFA